MRPPGLRPWRCLHSSSLPHLSLYRPNRKLEVSVQQESQTRKGGDMLRSTARVAVLSLLAAAVALPAAWGTTAVERTEGDMIQESTLIVTGHCTQLQSQWVGRTLVTLATVQVTEALKGSAG